MNKKKVLSAMLTLMMFASISAGCSGENEAGSSSKSSENTSAPSSASTSASETAKEPESTPITFTAFSNHPNTIGDWKWGDDTVTQEITKKTGVSVELTYANTTDNTELNTMLAAGVDLPDFIVANTEGSIRNMIVSQGFALPMNELADKHSPEFWEVLPTDCDTVYQEADGNLYLIPDFFDDTSISDYILNPNLTGSFCIDQEIYNEMGRPELKTIDDFINHLKAVKEKYPQITVPLWEYDPPSALLNVFQRMYGPATANVTPDGDTIVINQKADSYKPALQLYNRFFREGLINPETFTFKEEQKKAVAQARQVYCYFGKMWWIEATNGDPTDETYEGILTPMPEGRNLEEMTLPNSNGSIGGWHATYITKDCKDPARAIQYLTFLLSEEGQILQRHGVQGVTWDPDEFGLPKNNATMAEAQKPGDGTLERKYGVYNTNFGWLAENSIVCRTAHHTYADYPACEKDFKTNSAYCFDERIYNLATTLTNEDDRVLQKQITELVKKDASAVVLSKDDAEFESNYAKLMSNLTTSGIDKLEKVYQDQFAAWKEKGLK